MLTWVVMVGAALIAFGIGGVLLRRSLVGLLVALQLMVGGAALLAAGLMTLSGDAAVVGRVIALACVVVGVAAAVLLLALHLAAARAARGEAGLEPW
jgi:NADH:ubiquinone oxidoreductase subunit K